MTVTLPPFSALVEAHAGDLHRHLVAVAGSADAGDLLQETLLSALRAYPRLTDASNLRGWLFTVAHSRVVDAARARERRPVAAGAVPEVPATQPPPVDRDLWAVVRGLPPMQRAAIAHRYLADLPYAEIGQVIGCSEAAARQNVRAGLATLRKEIDGPRD